MPLHLHLGLPLFDTAMCAPVCGAIERRQLLSEESLAHHRAAAAALLERVRELVGRYGDGEDGGGPGAPPPYPVVHLLFDGTALRVFNEDELH